jgi:gamma-glutamyl-gamma-aminobutyrate hydrolase PuuD
VEAIQVDGAGFAIGVQWHAELMVDRPEHLALFESLVRAAEVRARDAAEAA